MPAIGGKPPFRSTYRCAWVSAGTIDAAKMIDDDCKVDGRGGDRGLQAMDQFDLRSVCSRLCVFAGPWSGNTNFQAEEGLDERRTEADPVRRGAGDTGHAIGEPALASNDRRTIPAREGSPLVCEAASPTPEGADDGRAEPAKSVGSAEV